jgi:parallel beta-helix repeat protein
MKKVIIVGLAAMVLATGVFVYKAEESRAAGTYYVSSSSGNDSNAGTQAAPWKTAAKVNSMTFQPGDQILFKRGDTWVADPLIPRSSGTAGNPITFGAYGTGNRPVLNGNNSTSFSGAHLGVIQVNGKNYVTIDGFHVTNTTKNSLEVYVQSGTSTGVIVRNCEVDHNNVSGFDLLAAENADGGGTNYAEGKLTNVLFENNIVHDGTWNGVTIDSGVTNSIVRNNTSYNNTHNGFNTKRALNSSNRNRGNSWIGNVSYGNGFLGGTGDGFFMADVADNLIEGNIAHNNLDTGFKLSPATDSSGGVYNNNTFRRNIAYDNGDACLFVSDATATKFYNNTCYSNDGPTVYLGSNQTGTVQANNLGYQNTSGNVSYNPLFVNAAAADFRLCEGSGTPAGSCTGRSQAIDAGVNVGLPYNGSAPDLGALESGGATPTPTPTPTPTSTPTPTPTPSATPSQKFIIGDRIQANANITVHSYAAYLTTNEVGTQPQGSQGTIVGGPTLGTDSAWWWQVDYDTGADGWNGESVLTKISSPSPTPTPTPGPVACSQYTPSTVIPTGYASPYDVVSSPTTNLMNATCLNLTDARLDLGKGDPLQYIYNQGYLFKTGGTSWSPVPYTSTEQLIANAWYPKSATTNISLTSTELANPSYNLAYICSWTGSSWKCGCRDSQCTQSYWQIQSFKR